MTGEPDHTGGVSNGGWHVPVVGIGASAGGIRALTELFATLPDRVGAAIVVVVHLAPDVDSELDQILARVSKLRILQVTERLPLEPDTVYVIPPGYRLLLADGSIEAAPFDEPRGLRAPIDQFFRSLAEYQGEGFAVILSGSGSDGALGVRAVTEKGGLVLVQDPSEAEHGSMPRAAIAAGADFVLPISALAAKLVELLRTRSGRRLATQDTAGTEEVVRRTLSLVRARTGHDFSRYKRATVLRRLVRRMQVTQNHDLDRYMVYLRDHFEEAAALFNDLLISVTSFFRDQAAYKALATEVIPNLFQGRRSDEPIRVWIAGCATGEEAYSIAILLLEEATRRDARPDIQLFATDLDAHALATAREGRYPSTIATEVSDERLRRFFTREGDQYRIRREVRDLVVFAVHSLLRDPPFSRIDLVSCRNLLIYLDRELQHQLCSVLHYALVPRGYLFLGSSETADLTPSLFTSIDRDARIYQAIERSREQLPMLPRSMSAVRVPDLQVAHPARLPVAVDTAPHRQMLEDIAPPSIMIDETQAIVTLSESAGRFLYHSGGVLSADSSEIVRPELRLKLRSALHRAFEQNEPTISLPIAVRFDETVKSVALFVRPIKQGDAQRVAIVMFLEGGPAELESRNVEQAGASTVAVEQLRDELFATRSVLRSTREQYEATTEELRAANEELQSVNEEYRSTAEEFETSKEELQSINEELQTLNNELKIKLEMVSRAHNDLQNLMSATDGSTMFLDATLRIQRFTPRMAELFSIQQGDEGRPVTDFTHRLDYQELVQDARRVLADLAPIERTVRTTGGRWFMIRLRPYRTLDNKIDGIVATFVDVTERREAEAAWEKRQKMLLDELSHRVKNTLAVVQAVTRQTLRRAVQPELLNILELRLDALAQAHDLLVRNEWRGASLEALVRQQLAPYLGERNERVSIAGPPVILPPAIATPLGLALHELATNAVKHGALKTQAGRVKLSWETRDIDAGVRVLELTWGENGGPAVTEPDHLGSGLKLVDHGLPNAHVKREFKPDGLVCTLTVPLSAVIRE